MPKQMKDSTEEERRYWRIRIAIEAVKAVAWAAWQAIISMVR